MLEYKLKMKTIRLINFRHCGQEKFIKSNLIIKKQDIINYLDYQKCLNLMNFKR